MNNIFYISKEDLKKKLQKKLNKKEWNVFNVQFFENACFHMITYVNGNKSIRLGVGSKLDDSLVNLINDEFEDILINENKKNSILGNGGEKTFYSTLIMEQDNKTNVIRFFPKD